MLNKRCTFTPPCFYLKSFFVLFHISLKSQLSMKNEQFGDAKSERKSVQLNYAKNFNFHIAWCLNISSFFCRGISVVSIGLMLTDYVSTDN